jgi:hypothetical protein
MRRTIASVLLLTITLTNSLAFAETQCERDKRNKLAECLSEARDGVNDCQNRQCLDQDDEDVNTCRRTCSESEMQERNECFAADKAIVCP